MNELKKEERDKTMNEEIIKKIKSLLPEDGYKFGCPPELIEEHIGSQINTTTACFEIKNNVDNIYTAGWVNGIKAFIEIIN